MYYLFVIFASINNTFSNHINNHYQFNLIQFNIQQQQQHGNIFFPEILGLLFGLGIGSVNIFIFIFFLNIPDPWVGILGTGNGVFKKFAHDVFWCCFYL